MAIVQILVRVLHVAMVQAMKHAALLRAMVLVLLAQVLHAALALAMKHAALLHAMAQVLRVQAHHVQAQVLRAQVPALHALAQVQVLNAAQQAVRHKAVVTAILMATSGKKMGMNDCSCPDSN